MENQHPKLMALQPLQKAEGLQNIGFNDILESHFVTLLVGKPGSGKSSLVEQLLLNPELYHKKFSHVLIITPQKFDRLNWDPENYSPTLDLSWLAGKIDQLGKLYQHKGGVNNLLVIFDDVISDLKIQERNPFIQNLFNNRRHLLPNCTISIMITTQKFNLCPLKFRTILTSVYFFSLPTAEFESLWRELCGDAKEMKLQIMEQMGHLKPHDFFFIRLCPLKYYLNFRQLVTTQQLINRINQGYTQTNQQQQVHQPQNHLPQQQQQQAPKPPTDLRMLLGKNYYYIPK